MPDENEGGTTLLPLFDRLAAGDTSAADEIITHAMGRLTLLARKRLKSFPAVRGLHETGDVVQEAAMRLHRALKEVRPASVAQFMRLASTQIRRELIDLKRHEFGVGEDRVRVEFGPGGSTTQVNRILDGPDRGAQENARRGEQLRDIEERVERLPEEERTVFELSFYQGMSQEEVARFLCVSVPTVKRRWRSARLLLHAAVKGVTPGG